MPTAVKAILALVFVGAIGFVLLGPVLRAGDRVDPRPPVVQPEEEPEEEPDETPSPEPAPDEGSDDEGDAQQPLTVSYPRACLRPVPPPSGEGLVAVAWDTEIQIGTMSEARTPLRGAGPISWSPSGRYLAFDDGKIYDAETEEVIADGPGLARWAWSPVSDCLLGIGEDGAIVVQVPARRSATAVLGATSPRSFRFSADGRFLKIRSDDARPNVVDLSARGPDRLIGTAPGDFRAPEPCPPTEEPWVETCSPDGSLVVGALDNQLTLASADGSGADRLTEGEYEDFNPEWGPRGTGILFLRHPIGTSERVEVWYFPEGAEDRPTPYSFVGYEGFAVDEFPWAGVIDWNVTPPRAYCAGGVCLER